MLDKVKILHKRYNVNDILVVGGVSCNKRFRDKLDILNQQKLYKIHYPPIQYCTDNAAMICIAGYEKAINKEFSDISLDIYPNLLMNQR